MVLKISDLKKKFKGIDGEPDFILDLPDLKFEKGKIVYIMGPNGSGKSVLLRLMAGEILPTSGHVEIADGKRRWKAHRKASSIVRQKAEESLAIDLTVQENLMLRIKTRSVIDDLFPEIRLRKKVKQILNSHEELSKKLDQVCRNLSGGQKQTLAFLAVASNKSELLFLDEFLSATDQSTRTLLLNLARNYSIEVPACVIIVTHDLSLALENGDRIILLRNGRLRHDIKPGDKEWNEVELKNLLS